MATSQGTILDALSPELRSSLSPDQIQQLSQQPQDAEALFAEYKLALHFSSEGNYKAAKELLCHNLAARRGILGKSHAETLATMHYLGLVETNLGYYAAGEAIYRELIPLYEKPAASLGARSNLGWVLNKEGKYTEAELSLRQLLPDLKERFGEDDPRTLGCLRHLIEAVGRQGRIEEALEMNKGGMDVVTSMTGEHRADELKAMKDVGAQLEEWKHKG